MFEIFVVVRNKTLDYRAEGWAGYFPCLLKKSHLPGRPSPLCWTITCHRKKEPLVSQVCMGYTNLPSLYQRFSSVYFWRILENVPRNIHSSSVWWNTWGWRIVWYIYGNEISFGWNIFQITFHFRSHFTWSIPPPKKYECSLLFLVFWHGQFPEPTCSISSACPASLEALQRYAPSWDSSAEATS